MQVRFLPSLVCALWLQALGIGMGFALPLHLVHLDCVGESWPELWPLASGILIFCWQVVVAGGSALLTQLVALRPLEVADIEASLLGHRAALWGSRLVALLVLVGVLGMREGGKGVGQLLAGFLAGSAIGLMWSGQVFDSPSWWSTADVVEGASLVLLLLLVTALHWGRARSRRAFGVAVGLGALLLAGFGEDWQVSAPVHWTAGGVCSWASAVLLAGVALPWFVRRCRDGAPAWLYVPSLAEAPRAACLSALLLCPYAAVAAAVDEPAWAHVSAVALQGLVCASPARARGFVAVSWAVVATCDAGRCAVFWACCNKWVPVLWWVHLTGIVLYYCVLAGMLAPAGVLEQAGLGIVAVSAVMLLGGHLWTRGKWNSGVRRFRAPTFLSP